jgi:glycerol-3-phosphate dehydrogenase (NAD(P)+)
MKQTTVVCMGAGAMGQIIGAFISKQNTLVQVEYWDAILGKVPNQKSLEEIIPCAQVVFLCVPSFAVREASLAIAPLLKKSTPVITIAKGIEEKTGKTVTTIMRETLRRGQPSGLLSGPMLAEELRSDLGGAGVIAIPSSSAYKVVSKLFSGTKLRVLHSKEAETVALAGVLKNVFALTLGVAEGLGWGNNRKGLLVAEAVSEMYSIIQFKKMSPQVVLGLAGLGDLVATGFSSSSRNHQVGKKLVTSGEGSSEGTRSLPAIMCLVRGIDKKKLPLLYALNKVITKKSSAQDVFESLVVF